MKRLLPIIVMAALAAGCTHVTVTKTTTSTPLTPIMSPTTQPAQCATSTTLSVSVWRFGYDTKLGKLSAKQADGGSFDFENLDSNARAIDAVNKALDLAGATAKKVP